MSLAWLISSPSLWQVLLEGVPVHLAVELGVELVEGVDQGLDGGVFLERLGLEPVDVLLGRPRRAEIRSDHSPLGLAVAFGEPFQGLVVVHNPLAVRVIPAWGRRCRSACRS